MVYMLLLVISIGELKTIGDEKLSSIEDKPSLCKGDKPSPSVEGDKPLATQAAKESLRYVAHYTEGKALTAITDTFTNQKYDFLDDEFSEIESYFLDQERGLVPAKVKTHYTLSDIFGDRLNLLTTKGVFHKSIFKKLVREINKRRPEERPVIINSFEPHLSEDQRRTLLNS